MTEYLVVPGERVGIELDEFLCLLFPLVNKGYLRREVREGRVLVDGEPAKPSQRLRRGQVVVLDIEEEALPAQPLAPRGVEIPVLHEDDHLLVVDKPAGIAVEPERWRRDEACVSGALLAMAIERSDLDPELPGEEAVGFRPRLVHRLDKDTTGVLAVAKDLEAERALRAAFESGQVRKEYLALVEGEHPGEPGEERLLDHPIAPDTRRSGRMRVHAEGKPARTLVSVEERFRGFTLLRCRPITGRTHQIRVHLSYEGFPLAVDRAYGRRSELRLSELKRGYKPKRGRPELPLIGRLTLHALALTLPDLVRGGEPLRVEAPMPKDFERALKQLAKVRSPRSRR